MPGRLQARLVLSESSESFVHFTSKGVCRIDRLDYRMTLQELVGRTNITIAALPPVIRHLPTADPCLAWCVEGKQEGSTKPCRDMRRAQIQT